MTCPHCHKKGRKAGSKDEPGKLVWSCCGKAVEYESIINTEAIRVAVKMSKKK